MNKKNKYSGSGKNSYLSKNYIKLSKFKKNIKLIKHSNIKKINFDKFTHLINFSIDPKIFLKSII